MNRDDIIRMAREVSNTPIDHHATPDLFGVTQIERFAALVAKHTLANIDPSSFMSWQEGYAAGAAAEREACAKVCEAADKSTHPADLADAIRARGQV